VRDRSTERNAGVPPERRIEFRIGIHIGDVVEENGGDLMGDASISLPILFTHRQVAKEPTGRERTMLEKRA
jgi:hypothetical protein